MASLKGIPKFMVVGLLASLLSGCNDQSELTAMIDAEPEIVDERINQLEHRVIMEVASRELERLMVENHSAWDGPFDNLIGEFPAMSASPDRGTGALGAGDWSDITAAAERSVDQLRTLHRRLKESLAAAEVSVELDDRMIVGQEYVVAVLVQGHDGAGATPELNGLAARIAAPTMLQDTIEVLPHVSVELVAGDFEMTQESESWQTVIPDQATIWTWKLKPSSAGTKSIMFILSHRIRTQLGEEVLPVQGYPRTVLVEVKPPTWRERIAGWYTSAGGWLNSGIALLAGIVTVLTGGRPFVRWVKRRRKVAAADTAVAEKQEVRSEGAKEPGEASASAAG